MVVGIVIVACLAIVTVTVIQDVSRENERRRRPQRLPQTPAEIAEAERNRKKRAETAWWLIGGG